MAGLALASENTLVIQEALKRYATAEPEDLEAEFRSLFMSAAVRFGDSSVINKLIDLHKTTNSPDIRDDICGALTSTKDIEVGKKLLTLLKNKDHVRPQDLVRWFAYLLRNKYTREITWQWLKENWEWIMQTFASSKSYDYFPRYAANFMNSEYWLEEYKTFFIPMLKNPSLNRTIKIGIKEIEARIAWRRRDENKISEWFNNQSAQ
jgi:aminopeptidase N